MFNRVIIDEITDDTMYEYHGCINWFITSDALFFNNEYIYRSMCKKRNS